MNKEKSITSKTTKVIKKQIIDFLIKDKLKNYGYEIRDWRRLQRQRSKAKAILKIADINKLRWHELGLDELKSRLQIKTSSEGKVDIRYITCQSRNEEVTNIIRRLVGLKGWAS